MTSMRAVVVAGLAVAAASGLASPAMAAPAKPAAPAPNAKAPVTTDQCLADRGRVQRAKDGVGTCVGGKDDGHLIKDVSTRRADGTTASPSTTTPSSSADARHPYGEPGYDSGYRTDEGRRDYDRDRDDRGSHRGLLSGDDDDRSSDDSDGRSSDSDGRN